MLNLLSELVDKSLVVAESLDDGSTWYRLLETMRQYGWQRLTGSGETIVVQRRHAVFYLAFSERADRELMGAITYWQIVLQSYAEDLRAQGISADLTFGDRKLGKQLGAADRARAHFACRRRPPHRRHSAAHGAAESG